MRLTPSRENGRRETIETERNISTYKKYIKKIFLYQWHANKRKVSNYLKQSHIGYIYTCDDCRNDGTRNQITIIYYSVKRYKPLQNRLLQKPLQTVTNSYKTVTNQLLREPLWSITNI